MSLYATAQGTGQALGPVVAGYLIAAGRFDLAFMAAAVIGLATPVMVARWLPAAQSSRAPVRWAAFKAGLTEVAGHRLVLVTSAAHAAQFVINGAPECLSAAVRAGCRRADGRADWMVVRRANPDDAGGAPPDWVTLGPRRPGTVIVTGLITCSVAVFAMAASDRGALIAAAIVVYAAGVATTTAATSAYITDLTPRERYGAAHGVFGTIYDIGDALGPIGAGFVVAAFGYTTLFRVLTVIGVSMAVAFALATRSRGR